MRSLTGKSKLWASIAALAFSLLYLAAIVTGNAIFLGSVWVALAALLAVLVALFSILAGITVVKALFVVAAELSLLIFLTQSYCATPSAVRLPQSDAAMTSLFTVATLYIGFLFIQSLWDGVKTHYKKIEGRPGTWEKWATMIAFAAFTLLFLWELYLVIDPIVAGLCVYK